MSLKNSSNLDIEIVTKKIVLEHHSKYLKYYCSSQIFPANKAKHFQNDKEHWYIDSS